MENRQDWLQHGVYGVSAAAQRLLVLRPTLVAFPATPSSGRLLPLFGVEHYRAVLNAQVVADLVTCWWRRAGRTPLRPPRAMIVLWIAPSVLHRQLRRHGARRDACVHMIALPSTLRALAGRRPGLHRWLWTVAAALAYSILLRPEQGLLAAAVLRQCSGSLATREPSLRPLVQLCVLAAAFCVALPLLFWTARNERVFHVFQPLSPRNASDPGDPVVLQGFGRWYRTWAIDFRA